MADAHPVTVRALDDSVAVIAGGTSGIGLAAARRLAQAGVTRIVLCGRDEARGNAARDALAADAGAADIRFVAADVATVAGAERLIEQATQAFRRVDVLVNAAGVTDLPRLLHEIPLDQVGGIVERGLLGVLLPTRAVLPAMMAQNGGSVVNIASDAAKLATPGESVIGAVMAAILMFSRTAAIEAKRSGIRVNCITPSIVRGTALYDRLMADEFCGKLFGKAERLADLGVAEADDLAALVVFLASPAAAKLTGQGISVNGGISAA